MVKNVRFSKDSMDTTYDISNLIKKSPKIDAMLQKFRKDISLEYSGFRVLGPTRLTVMNKSMKSILDNCVALQQVWDESLDGNLEPEIKGRAIGVKSQMNTFNYFYGISRAIGVKNQMNTFNYFYGITILQLVLRQSDNLSRTLQKYSLTSCQGK